MTSRSSFTCATALLVAPFAILTACSSDPQSPAGAGGSTATGGAAGSAGTVGNAGSSGSSTAGTTAGGAAGSTATGGAGAGGQSTGGGGAAMGGSAGAGGAAGGAGGSGGAGGAGGAAGAGGAGGSSGSGGAGGAACGTITKANDGSYVRTGWTGEYTCSGGECPAKNPADTGDVATKAFDGNYQTRWSTGVYQKALAQQNRFPLFFTVDMQKSAPVSKLTTHPGCQDIFDSPGTIEVQVSTDGTNYKTVTTMPHTPQEPGNEACPPNMSSVAIDTITFPTTCARYVRLKGTQRTTSDRYWAIGEMNIYP